MAEVVDVDSHVYEPPAIWDDYVPAADRAGVASAFWSRIDGDGTVDTTLNGQPAKGLNRSKVIRQAIWRPGLTIDEIGGLDPNVAHPINPARGSRRRGSRTWTRSEWSARSCTRPF